MAPRDPLTAIASAYRPLTEPEATDLDRIRDLIGTGDAWSRDQPLHVTASALIVDARSDRVLLRWHARMRLWLQVGGHADPGEEDPWLVAWREAREETGLPDLVPLGMTAPRPVQIVIVPVPGSTTEPAHEHADIRYVLSTKRPNEAVAESPEAALRWATIAEAEEAVQEDNLKECLRRIGRTLVPRP